MFWNNKKEEKKQAQIQNELQILDDIFHRTITALERLELFLDGNKANVSLIQTAAGGKRDFHDPEIDRGSDAYYDELALKCNALFMAAKFDDEDVFKSAATVFVNDTLEWYAGREGMGYNAVDAAIIPIFVAITRQAKSAGQVDKMFDDYVYKPQESPMSIDDKYEATKDMVEAWIKANHMNDEGVIKETRESEQQEIYTSHKRGDAIEGFKRMFSFVTTKYDTTFPAKLFVKTIREFSPAIASQFKDVNEDAVEHIFEMKRESKPLDSKQQVVDATDSTSSKEVPFVVVNEKEDKKDDSSTSSIEKIYPQLVEVVKEILDEKGIIYSDIKISIS